jgi:hypothetical protein
LKHNAQAAEQAIVEQEQEQLEAMHIQPGSIAAAAAGAAVATAARQALFVSQPSAAAAGQLPAWPPPLWLARFCAGWVHASLGTVSVSLLEKQKRWGEAVEVRSAALAAASLLLRRAWCVGCCCCGRTRNCLEGSVWSLQVLEGGRNAGTAWRLTRSWRE